MSKAASPQDAAEPEGPPSDPAPPSASSRPRLWVSTTYFAEGFPYSVVNNLAEILFTELGAGLRMIGLTALFHLPWNLKFLWGPFVDRFETKRRWLLGVEVALVLALVALAMLTTGGAVLSWIAAAFLLVAVLSATHDIAIDGFYLEGLDEQGQSRFIGYRAMAYKVASLLVRGPLIILIGVVGWTQGLLATAVVMALVTAAHALILPRVERRGRPLSRLVAAALRPRNLVVAALVAACALAERQLDLVGPLWRALRAAVAASPLLGNVSVAGWISMALLATLMVLLLARTRIRKRLSGSNHYYSRAFLDFLEQPRVAHILAFVVLFRAGESFLQKMKWPFLREHVELSLEQYGFANGTLGVLASFAGTLVGGWLIARHGLRRWIWPFVIAQNLLNLLYVGLAALARDGGVPLTMVTSVITVEHFGEGLGTAVFMVYLMRCCDPAHKAAHMAILTALMSVSFTLAGVVSGFLAEAWGFGPYFAFCFAATFPGMVLIPWLPYLDGRRVAAPAGRAPS
ncbi:MAG: MFS transporter [Deltaproteobacteria bacterium]|jgi:PAT family beta-lactamase induction signal transducer AmpG|nr:MFS transporter [Deltaproteobacteria bacterium]MBW2532399.1 MFS transporter [Deltaproteobacteria bacterium]